MQKIKDFNPKEVYGNMKELVNQFLESYTATNSEKLRLIDCFIVFNAILVVLQIIYVIFNGLDPVNSLLAGVFSCLGFMTLLGKKEYNL